MANQYIEVPGEPTAISETQKGKLPSSILPVATFISSARVTKRKTKKSREYSILFSYIFL